MMMRTWWNLGNAVILESWWSAHHGIMTMLWWSNYDDAVKMESWWCGDDGIMMMRWWWNHDDAVTMESYLPSAHSTQPRAVILEKKRTKRSSIFLFKHNSHRSRVPQNILRPTRHAHPPAGQHERDSTFPIKSMDTECKNIAVDPWTDAHRNSHPRKTHQLTKDPQNLKQNQDESTTRGAKTTR